MVDFVRGANPIWYLVDLDANAFDDNFYMWVLENTLPYQPAAIYQDENGTPRANPVQFLSNGTLPINLYFDENITYRLEFRENDGINPPSQADDLIYLVENYNPLGSAQNGGDVDAALVTNQITNPQFAEYNLGQSVTLTAVANPDPLEIAPGWVLTLTGTGSVTIERTELNSATQTPTNAPYALRLNLSGSWTSATLRQRLFQNGVLWSERFVSGGFTARIDGGSQNVSIRLDDSMGAPLGILVAGLVLNVFREFNGNVLLPETTNTDFPPDAYLDYKVILPTTGDIYLTSFNLVPTSADVVIPYGQESVNRQIDQTFNYYKSKLEEKPIPSHLIGWDFPRNPAQWGENYAVAAIGANKSDYVWDQTIIFQSQDDGFTASRDVTGALKVEIEVDDTQIAVIQYIEQAIARAVLNDRISVHIAAKTSVGTGQISGVVSLWYTSAALPDMSAGTNDSIVATLNIDGTVATQNGTWFQVPRRGTEDAEFTIDSSTTNEPEEIMLNGWDLEGSTDIDTVTTMAIVVAFSPMDDGEIIDFHSIAMCSGDIATKPAPVDMATTSKACERYYEKSYNSSDAAGSITSDNSLVRAQSAYFAGGNVYKMILTGFDFNFMSEKFSVAPIVNLYNPATGTVDQVLGYVSSPPGSVTGGLASINWNSVVNNKRVNFMLGTYIESAFSIPGFVNGACAGWIEFHYVADSRIGIA